MNESLRLVIGIIEESRSKLETTAAKLRSLVEVDTREQVWPAIVLDRCAESVIHCHHSVLLLLERHLIVPAAILTRSAFELSLRLVWASEAESGWDRLRAHWASDHVKWAQSAKRVPELESLADTILADGQLVLASTQAKRMPNVKQILEEIHHKHEPGSASDAEFFYLVVFGLLSNATHFHATMLDMGSPSYVARHIATTLVSCTVDIENAIASTYQWHSDETREWARNLLTRM